MLSQPSQAISAAGSTSGSELSAVGKRKAAAGGGGAGEPVARRRRGSDGTDEESDEGECESGECENVRAMTTSRSSASCPSRKGL